jgi:transcription-repair coupling factor (superfamily II helicase)
MQKVLHRLAEAQKNLFERNLYVVVGGLSAGFVLPEDRWIFITEEEIFGPRRRLRTSRVSRREPFAVGLADLSEGDFVVHRDHGIGRYMGTEVLRIGDTAEEYLKVLYAEDQRLFIPMSSITLLQKYLGIGDSVPALDRMGGQTWKKTKSKIKKELKEIADALLALYAKREVASGHSFSTPNHFYDEFVDAFEFEETEDQRKSIDEVARDMELPRPMDRLVCGDVGYGKTEVAMRAAFKAVMDGKQVAVLVPTTLLAQQHYQTFTDRFRSFPVTIEMLSRFKTPAEQKEIVTRLNEGKVDIVIGTHRLLQKDIRFKDLGLLVIDEEHRFGVGHKEKLKTFRETVDVLTLTATPIPRTLHISLMGIRDMSVITTPPQDRLAIKTVVCKFDQAVIRQAILREMERGGQVFFVHNRVESIHAMGSLIKRLVPKARLAVAHGQMPEKDLESIMIRYVRREFDVLLSTTIIESGLDIPNANTIIINRADKFGLAQLYQLRGRVGRDRHRAYGYLLVPGMDALTPTAKKRLKAIQELSELGAGFQLAVRDMEIRGVGNILGPQQSGQICAVGFETYCHLLEEAIQDVKGTAEKEKLPETTVKLGYTGSIPSDYIPDVNQRMEWYRTLFALESDERFQTVRGEILDRYGKPPEEMERLFSLVRLRCLGRGLGIERMELDSDKVYLFFNRNTPVNREKLLEMIGQRRNWFRLISEDALQYFLKGEGWREVSDHVISGLIRLRTICD